MKKPQAVWIAEWRENRHGKMAPWEIYLRPLLDGGWSAPAFAKKSQCQERCRIRSGSNVEFRPVKYVRSGR